MLLLIERVIPGPNRGLDATMSDLNMLVSPGGEERTEAEYATLLAAAGFRLTRVVPTASDVSIVEAVAGLTPRARAATVHRRGPLVPRSPVSR